MTISKELLDELLSGVERREEAVTVIPMNNIGQVYRTKIRQLTDGLNDPAIRLQAIGTIRSLIDHIKVTPTSTGFEVELHGELGAVLDMVDGNERRPVGLTTGRSVSVVAGGHPTLDAIPVCWIVWTQSGVAASVFLERRHTYG